jgi:hypothetical protein
MNLYQFLGASLDDRAAYVWQCGTMMAVRSWGNYDITLYKTGNYFAEVWLDRKESRIIMIPAFKDHHCFLPYLDSIELPQLFCS